MRTEPILRTGARVLAAIGLVAGGWLVAAPADAAPASSIDDVGWWARVHQEPTLGGLLAPPDVEEGQLLVEGTPEGATAIAAVRATLPEGATNPVLTLPTASAVGAEAAVLLACQTGSGWTGAHAGAWDAKPSPDCTQSVQGLVAEDGSSVSFALAPLQFGDQVDVVLTPGVVDGAEGAPSSAFRIVFEGPDVSSIEVTEGTATGSGPPPPIGPPVSFDTSPPPAIGAGSSGGSFTPPAPSSGGEVALPPVRAALPETEQGATATAPIAQAQQPLAAPALAATGGSDGRLLGVIVVLAAGALLYWSSQQPVPQRQLLSRFASAAPHPVDVVPAPETVGGLGRFRRERTGAARRLAG